MNQRKAIPENGRKFMASVSALACRETSDGDTFDTEGTYRQTNSSLVSSNSANHCCPN